MGTDQQFCLRWNNFHTNITSAFESLRDDEDFVDITLACEGRQVKAHKMVLSACSPYFRSLLRGNPCQHPIMFLKDVTFANLTSILDFMYHGEVNVSHNELATFLKTAEALKVRGLAEDEKRKESENCTESNSPIPSRDPPDPGSPGRPDDQNTPDTHAHSESPPPKRQRRRSVTSAHSAEDVNDTTPDPNVKDEPKDFVDEDDVIIASAGLDTTPDDIKADLHCLEENGDEKSFGPSDSVTISRSQAMQHLQESFGSFLPNMSQSPSFLSHGASDMPRPPTFSMESVQGLPPGISALPGPSMSQGAASQDSSQGFGTMTSGETQQCPICLKILSRYTSMRRHFEDRHTTSGNHVCPICQHVYKSRNSLHNHLSVYHRGLAVSRGRRSRIATDMSTALKNSTISAQVQTSNSTKPAPICDFTVPTINSTSENMENSQIFQENIGTFESLLMKDKTESLHIESSSTTKADAKSNVLDD